ERSLPADSTSAPYPLVGTARVLDTDPVRPPALQACGATVHGWPGPVVPLPGRAVGRVTGPPALSAAPFIWRQERDPMSPTQRSLQHPRDLGYQWRSNGLPSSYRLHDISLLKLAKRQHVYPMIHFVHFCLNTISSANRSAHLGGFIDMQPQFMTVKRLDQIVFAVNAQHFAFNGIDASQCFFITLQEMRLSGHPISTRARTHSCLRGTGET